MGFTHCIWNIRIVLRNILVLFIYLLKNFLIIPHDMQNLSSPTRYPTHDPWVGNMSLNHWTARQGLTLYLKGSTTPIYTQQKIYMPANLKTQQWPQDWKRSVFIPIPKKGNAKECSNYSTVALISHANKTMLKILQSKLQQCVNWEIPYIQAGFRKGTEEPEIKLPTSAGS